MDAEHSGSDIEDAEVYDHEVEPSSNSLSLYDGSAMSVKASVILIMQFKTKHNLMLDGLEDLLKLIKLHCPSNQCISSPYLLKKHFFTDVITYHNFCSNCLLPISDVSQPNCPNMCSPSGEK